MSKPGERMVLSPQARKLIEQHSRAIDAAAEEAARKMTSPASALGAVCTLLNQRARYFGATGEHFSVHEYDGIQVVDALDERLLKALAAVLGAYLERSGRGPSPEAAAFLEERLAPGADKIPPYPVGYMTHYLLVRAFQLFEPLAAGGGGGLEPADLERAMLHHVQAILRRYVESRERPVTRHFSDVAREYSVVLRLRCPCGAEKYDVKLQALCQTPQGAPYDRLDLQCRDCGAQRSITFNLPHFKDMYRL